VPNLIIHVSYILYHGHNTTLAEFIEDLDKTLEIYMKEIKTQNQFFLKRNNILINSK